MKPKVIRFVEFVEFIEFVGLTPAYRQAGNKPDTLNKPKNLSKH
jgi:hypothetical protein